MKKNISQLQKGLHTDFNIEEQPKGTYRFALNAINSSYEGDDNLKSNEEGNTQFCGLPEDTIILGKIYFKTDKVLLFLVKTDNSVSYIGVFDVTLETFTVIVDDTLSTDKLNFKYTNQIQGVYRNRRGCEDVFYFVQKGNVPRFFNLTKLEQFKDSLGNWVGSQFSLQTFYKKIPTWDDITIKEGSGVLKPGSYIYGIQYLDHDLSPTEVITFSKSIKLYTDSTTSYYPDVCGSSVSDNIGINSDNTGKAVELKLFNLDTEYPFYRVVIMAANSGAGVINEVLYSNPIDTNTLTFTHSGLETFEKGNLQEVAIMQSYMESATSIEQIDNRLVLGNITGPQENFCNLQQYASRITTDCILKKVLLNTFADNANSKNGEHEFYDGVGFMPGEIYSFGIIYIFEDNTLSPVYHIPGKRVGHATTVFSPENDGLGNPIVFPMRDDNACQDITYPETGINCIPGGFWGIDYAGLSLNNAKVRHHRFPTRKQLGIRTADMTTDTTDTYQEYHIDFKVKGALKLPVPCPAGSPGCGTDYLPPFYFKINYTIDGIPDFYIVEINPNSYPVQYSSGGVNVYVLNETHSFAYTPNSTLTVVSIEVTDVTGTYQDATTFDYSVYFTSSTLTVLSATKSSLTKYVNKIYYSGKILGLKLSSIEKPPVTVTGGKEVIGYYITRQNRKDDDKTILDSAVMFPNYKSKNGKYIGSGLFKFENQETNQKDNYSYSFISLNHRFLGKEYTAVNSIDVQGEYYIVPPVWPAVPSNPKYRTSYYSLFRYDDVYNGSTWDSKTDRKQDDDAKDPDGLPNSKGLDGWTIDIAVRDTLVAYSMGISGPSIATNTISRIFYLDALDSKDASDLSSEYYNVAADNKVGIIKYDSPTAVSPDRWPYVYLKRNVNNPYGDFMQRPYYIQSKNPTYFTGNTKDTYKLFSGDSYLSPIRAVNTMFYQNRPAFRNKKIAAWKIIVGIIIAAAAIVLAVFTAGGSIAVGAGVAGALFTTAVAAAGAGLMLASSGIKQAAFAKAYGEAYGKGLRESIEDWFFTCMFKPYSGDNLNFQNTDSHFPFFPLVWGPLNESTGLDGPSDDTIEYCVDALTNLWFDSSINTNLRNDVATNELSGFAKAPYHKETGQISFIATVDIQARDYVDSNQRRPPVSELEKHIDKKLLKFSATRDDGREYLGAPLGELYSYNPDYFVNNHIRPHFALSYGYDCCEGCNEKFPHRVLYSEQSFQEELTDNYRKFLPNNYRDIDGSTGAITNLYTIGSNLFIHTEEAVYQLPRQQQQMIVDQTLTFVGTGEYFSIPPIKLVDDNTGHSFGTTHKWASIKTPHGVFFVCELQKQICLLTENGVKSITLNNGLNKWFKENLKVNFDELIYNITGSKYNYRDNPSNSFGTGFITTYDSLNERLIVTKKDFINESLVGAEDIRFCTKEGILYSFPNYQATIDAKIADGWTYNGIEDCKMKFSAITLNGESGPTVNAISTQTDEVRDVVVYFAIDPLDANYADIKEEIRTWYDTLQTNAGGFNGKLFYLYDYQSHYRWLRGPVSLKNSTGFLYEIDSKTGIESPVTIASVKSEINLITVTTDTTAYHSTTYSLAGINTPTATYDSDFADFFSNYDTLINTDGFDIVFNNFFYLDTTLSDDVVKTQLQHQLASIYIFSPTIDGMLELMAETIDLHTYTDTDFINVLGTVNPYPQDTVTNYGTFKDLNFSATAFSVLELNKTFENKKTDADVVVMKGGFQISWGAGMHIDYYTLVFTYVEGVPVGDIDDNNASWTMSYDIMDDYWISWHSYLPHFYIHTPNKYFSWRYGDDNIYRHLVKGLYNSYYGEIKPFILEMVSNSNNLIPRVFENVNFYSKALKYITTTDSYIEEPFITFNKALFYNSRQISGWNDLQVKDTSTTPENYFEEQITNSNSIIIIDRNEGIWSVNDLRDYRKDQLNTMFIEKINSIQTNYFIDKEVNTANIDLSKNWSEIELFRDRYLAMRFLFDNFDNIKILIAITSEMENESIRL